MSDTRLRIFSLSALALLGAAYFFIQLPREAARKDVLTFSTTASWDSFLLAISEKQTKYQQEMFANIVLPPPPKNSSREVARELATLHSYEALRTPQKTIDIVTEVMTRKVAIGGHSIEAYADRTQFPATAALLWDSIHDVQVIEMQQKKKFDRVRPSVFDPSLSAIIAVPGHPAYPSYHSTEMHFYAYVFGELAPARKEEFVVRAKQVALNREIAGVHYPSDSAAGVLLAQQLFDIFMHNEKFLGLLADAKREWATHPELVQAQANP